MEAWNGRSLAGRSGGEGGGTKAIASLLGVMVGISGLDHGFFETLQGNSPTPALIVKAIGPDQRMWVHGTEEALTLVPNYLVSGLLAISVAVLAIVWSLRFIGRPRGSLAFLGLGVLLLLVGGGVAMFAFVLFTWAVARRIHRPLTWWRAIVPTAVGRTLARRWPFLVVVALALYAFALEVAIVGVVPGVANAETRLYICWLSLLVMVGVIVVALIGASAQDLAANTDAAADTAASTAEAGTR